MAKYEYKYPEGPEFYKNFPPAKQLQEAEQIDPSTLPRAKQEIVPGPYFYQNFPAAQENVPQVDMIGLTQDEKMSMDSLASDLAKQGMGESARRLDWAADPAGAKSFYDFVQESGMLTNPSEREQFFKLEEQFLQERMAQEAHAAAMRHELAGARPQTSLPTEPAEY